MLTYTIFHNPRCSKSRACLKILTEQGVPIQVVEYLKDKPDEARIRDLASRLGLKPSEFIRTGEAEYKEQHFPKGFTDDETLFRLMGKYPKLIERPIVVADGRAILCRPPEKVF